MVGRIRLLKNEKIIIDAQPDSNVIWYWLFTFGLRYIIAVAFIVFVLQLVSGPANRFMLQVMVVILAAIAYFGWAALNRKFHYYAFTNFRCISETGIINKRNAFVGYDRIADVHVARNWLERLLGLSSIIAEDFSGNKPMRMQGLEKETAEKITFTISTFLQQGKTK